jgi:hypothetical protein
MVRRRIRPGESVSQSYGMRMGDGGMSGSFSWRQRGSPSQEREQEKAALLRGQMGR